MNIETKDHLRYRFGNPPHYKDSFLGINRCQLFDKIYEYDSMKILNQLIDKDVSRQQFLKLVKRKGLEWVEADENSDLGAHISVLFHIDDQEYLAYMRLQPSAMRTERVVPDKVEMAFHCLFGQVEFRYQGRLKQLLIGSYITIRPRTIYSIKNLSDDQPSYLLFRLVKMK